MEVTINKYGLYRNIVPRIKIPTLKSGVYDNQTQGWWLPFKDDQGEYWFVDTYHIDAQTLNYRDPLTSFVEFVENHRDGTYIIAHARNNSYYGGTVKVTPEILKDYFELVCDLREFEISKCSPSEYNDEDVVTHVQFYFEHAYGSTGVTLLRKDAQKDATRVAATLRVELTNDVGFFMSSSKLEELKRYAIDSNVEQQERKRCQVAVKYLEEMKELKAKESELKRNYYLDMKKLKGNDEECL